jgi:hypothetical protein
VKYIPTVYEPAAASDARAGEKREAVPGAWKASADAPRKAGMVVGGDDRGDGPGSRRRRSNP